MAAVIAVREAESGVELNNLSNPAEGSHREAGVGLNNLSNPTEGSHREAGVGLNNLSNPTEGSHREAGVGLNNLSNPTEGSHREAGVGLNNLSNRTEGSHREAGVGLNNLSNRTEGSHREAGVGLNNLSNRTEGSHREAGVGLNNLSNPTEGSHREAVTVYESNFPYEEIRNVLWIEDSEEHQAALKEWDRKESYLSKKVDRKEKRSADLTNHIFNIVGFFSVFQGVVLTAVSQLKSSNAPLCGMVWVPAVLSSVAALVTIIGVWIKFSTLEKLETSIHNEKVAQTAVAARATKLRAKGSNFDFSVHAKEGSGRKPSSWIWISRIGVILSLFFFTGLFILSYVVILCNSLAVHKWNHQ